MAQSANANAVSALTANPNGRPVQAGTAIATIIKNSAEELRIRLSEYRGAHLVDLRIFVPSSGEGSESIPTKKGVSLKVEKIDELMAALVLARAEAERLGILKGGAA